MKDKDPSTVLRGSSVTCSCAPSNNIAGLRARRRGADLHLVRRQMLRPFQEPLVVMTPEVRCCARRRRRGRFTELANGSFQAVIPELDPIEAGREARRRVLRQGLYELVAKRKELQRWMLQ